MSVIPKGSTVLVTGVNGYIASNVADQLLAAGYKVRGTSRSAAKAQYLVDIFDKKYGPGLFSVAEVPDMIHPGAFDDAVKGVSGICHLASVLTFHKDPEKVIPPTVAGTVNIIGSARKEAGVKSLLLTSSSTAALLPQPNKKIIVTEDTWDDEAVEQVRNNPDVDPFVIYGASKTEGERAFWREAKEANVPFQVATLLPNANFGPFLKPGGEEDSSTGSWVTKLFRGDTSLLHYPPQYFVHVVDDAKLHVAVLTDPESNGKRFFGFAAPYSWNSMLAEFRKLYPDRKFPDDKENEGEDLSEVPNAKAEALLKKYYGHGWTSFADTIKEATAALV